MSVTVALAQEMLYLVGLEADPVATIEDGSALEKWRAMVSAQGGDPDAKMPEAPERRTFDAPYGGFLADLNARAVGIAAWRLGAGRARKEDPVSPSAGIVCLKKPGDAVEPGEPILELHADDPDRFNNALVALDGAVVVKPDPPEPAEMILERIGP